MVTFEAVFHQLQLFLADGTGKGGRCGKASEFWFQVCIHSFKSSKSES